MPEKYVYVNVARYSPAEKRRWVDAFEVPFRTGMTVQVLLRYIYECLDPTMSFRDYRCGRGICNTCRVKLNGKTVRSCETLVQPGQEILLEPASNRVIRDLVIRWDRHHD